MKKHGYLIPAVTVALTLGAMAFYFLSCEEQPIVIENNFKKIQEAKEGILTILRVGTKDVPDGSSEEVAQDAVKACKPQVDAKCLGLSPADKKRAIVLACEEFGHPEYAVLLNDPEPVAIVIFGSSPEPI